MEPDEVSDLIDWGLAVEIGEEKGTRRIHRLFYSHDDSQCFVAIQDEKTKTVITILPVDYYENLASKIPGSFLDEAQQLVSCNSGLGAEISPAANITAAAASPAPFVFKIGGTVMNMQGKPRTFNLGSWPATGYEGSTARLLLDARFFKEMQNKINLKMRPHEYLVGLIIRHGSRGKAVWVDVESDGREICGLRPEQIQIVEPASTQASAPQAIAAK